MELQQLRYAVALADHRSAPRAAASLKVAQGALVRQLRRLEDELGAVLFQRGIEPVGLTPAGEEFVAMARHAVRAADEAAAKAAAFAGAPRGRLAIGSYPEPPRPRVPELLAEFSKRFPEAEVSLREEASDPLVRLVRRGELDVAIVGTASGQVLEDVDHFETFRDDVAAVVSLTHPLAARYGVRLADLVPETFIDGTPATGLRAVTDEAFRVLGTERAVRYEASDAATVARLAGLGLGVGLLPRTAAERELRAGARCRVVPIENAPVHCTCLVYRSGSLTPPGRAFLALASRYALG
ncbi:LysR family transcriptional regulator [Actinomadura gamaensis]|uniref:LysR family transcriptional regulator n=1 Tax=Actinomadura gamaensis TaxID=1763541 RepID=A0ABV9UFJ1_9ACTN